VGKSENDVIRALDGHDLKQMIWAALAWLTQHQEMINALNVFPVPDGDTGTNMTLTMTSAWEEIADFTEPRVGKMANKMAHGALMGARGNSGVILSQIWRGFAHTLDDKELLVAEDLGAAMRNAAETAYQGVVKPVEGTILTVVREVAENISESVTTDADLEQAFLQMVEQAKLSVSRTPSLLPVLRQAGVVDSGGQGLAFILEGMWRHLKGLPLGNAEHATKGTESSGIIAIPDVFNAEHIDFDENYPYDVQFIVVAQDMDVVGIRKAIEELGDCALTVGDPTTIKVHVHVADPGIPISYAATLGSLRDVVVEDMQAQYYEFIASREKQEAHNLVPGLIGAALPEETPAIGVVVVAAGRGLSKVLTSLGASAIIEGGQTMNPSTAQILKAVEQLSSEKVIILPNNKNILMAAKQAAEVSPKEVVVVPTRTVPQGVAALLALDQSVTLDSNVVMMLESFKEVITGEITWATRNVELNGIAVREGDAIGLLDGVLVVDAVSFDEAVRWLLAEADLDERELVTLYYGEGVTAEQAQTLANDLADAYNDLEFEVVEGAQPHYPYILSIE